MLLNKRVSIFVRGVSALPAAMLLGFILTIWFTYLVYFVVPILASQPVVDNKVFAAPVGTKMIIALLAIILHGGLVPLLLTFFRTVFTPAGRVPSWYKTHNRQVTEFFQASHGYSNIAVNSASDENNARSRRAGGSRSPGDADDDMGEPPVSVSGSFNDIDVDKLLEPGPHDPRYCKR
jgi:hypothetical protein